jgi:altronate dehydratase
MVSSEDSISPRLLRLAPQDNVACATATLVAGQIVSMDDATITVVTAIPIGHKVAVRAIAAGEKILKFGCPIGSATRDIKLGEHVHTHNLKSDYIPTFTFEKERRFVKESQT